MRSRTPFRIALAAFAFTAALHAPHSAIAQNRIASAAMESSSMVRLTGNTSPLIRSAVDEGAVDGAMAFTDLTINIQPSAAQEASLEALLSAQQDSASASFHKWLTPTQFGARFGLSDADLATLTAWLTAQGFTVTGTAPSRNAIHFSGTAAQISSAFQTEIHTYLVNGESHIANATDPALPSALAGVIGNIGGMNNFRPKPHHVGSTTVVPFTTQSGSTSSILPRTTDGSGNQYLSPADFAGIYDVKALYNSGLNGSASFPIAVVGQTAIRAADVTDFRSAFGLSSTNLPINVLVPNTGTSAINSTDDMQESDLDVEWSGAVAPSAPIYFIYTGNNTNYGVFDALQYAIQTYTVSGKVLPIISISYGTCESNGTAASFAQYETWFKQANAQGQTIVSAAGDAGAADCDYTPTAANSYQATKGLAVDYPASSAYVTGMGGTSFTGDLTSQSTYWGSTNSSTYGNELGLYIPAGAWNNTGTAALALSFKDLSATGGGASAFWAKPSWQTGVTGIPADGKRDVPDISLSADPNHDGYLYCTNLGCEGTSASFNIVGGTSAAAPSFAGILALVEQKLGVAQGNINPQLYALASTSSTYANAFHDVTTGNNIVPCVVSSTDTGCSGGLMGFSAGTGYDQVTGLGAVDANNLANVFGTGTTKATSVTTLTYTPSGPVTRQTVTLAATVAPATGTTVATGTVSFTVGGTTTTGTVNASGVATSTITFTTGGPQTVTAAYSGDANYYSSTATMSVPLTIAPSVNNVATTTTLTSNVTTIAVGSSLTLTAKVGPVNTDSGTIAGNVVFSSSTGTLGIVPLTVTASSGTATLTLPVSVVTLPVGSDVITATFGGGGTDGAGGAFLNSAGTATVTVTNPSISVTAANLTVKSGASGTSAVTITAGGGYTGTVNLTATTTSATLSGTYTFSPAAVTITSTGTGTSTFTFNSSTNSSAVSAKNIRGTGGVSMLVAGGGLSFATLLMIGLGGIRRRRWQGVLLALLVTSAIATAMGCGSSSSTTTTSTSTNTPAGTYPITIIGTDSLTGTITGSTTITLTVQ